MAPLAPIAIIGAGPAGLTLARLLELAHVPYIVFDRDESGTWADEHRSSGTLDIHKDSGQVALQDAGLLQNFQSIARYHVPTKIVDENAKVHADLPGEASRDKPEIDRKDLRRLLLDSVPASKLRWASKVQQATQEADGSVSMHFTDGRVESGFRLVVGADGAWSKVRELITSARPQYAAHHFLTTYLRPESPSYSLAASMAGRGNYLAMSQGQQLFLHHLGDESYELAVGLSVPEEPMSAERSLDSASDLWEAFLRDRFGAWAPQFADLIKSTAGPFRIWPLYSMSKACLPWKHVPGVTLVGDAAHVTVPSGDGVNQAMYDSLELARQIIKHGVDDLEAATEDYEKVLFPRAIRAIEKGRWYADNFYGAPTAQSFLEAAGMNKSV